MFFPHSDEKVELKGEQVEGDDIELNEKSPVYLNSPTIIYFNPNA